MEIDYKAIGKRIKRARMNAGLTQQTLSELAQLSTPYVSNIEHGKTKLGLPTIIAIANALSVSVDSLLCDSLIQPGSAYDHAFNNIIKDCSNYELRVLESILRHTKQVIRNAAPYQKDRYH